MTEKMRCLSVQQPWAWAIVARLKTIENRSWSTDHRGLIVIHAGANKAALNRLVKRADPPLPPIDLHYGALLGVADLIDVVPLSSELEPSAWAWGPICLRFANARRFKEPIPAKGQLNLYALPEQLVLRVQEALPTAETVERDETARAWESLLTHESSEADRVAGLYRSYVQLSDGDNALRLAKRAIVLHGDADAYVDRGVAKAILAAPDYPGALEDLKLAIDMDPRNGRAYRVRSLVYGELGESDRAEADLARANELGFNAGEAGKASPDSEG
jgi:tetratricopeptide (TPR) repeat protein